MEAAFRAADINKDGNVSIKEYIAILKKRGIYTNEKEIKQIFAIADRYVPLHWSYIWRNIDQ